MGMKICLPPTCTILTLKRWAGLRLRQEGTTCRKGMNTLQSSTKKQAKWLFSAVSVKEQGPMRFPFSTSRQTTGSMSDYQGEMLLRVQGVGIQQQSSMVKCTYLAAKTKTQRNWTTCGSSTSQTSSGRKLRLKLAKSLCQEVVILLMFMKGIWLFSVVSTTLQKS